MGQPLPRTVCLHAARASAQPSLPADGTRQRRARVRCTPPPLLPQERLRSLFEAEGFSCEYTAAANKLMENRKKREQLDRRFVQARPLLRSACTLARSLAARVALTFCQEERLLLPHYFSRLCVEGEVSWAWAMRVLLANSMRAAAASRATNQDLPSPTAGSVHFHRLPQRLGSSGSGAAEWAAALRRAAAGAGCRRAAAIAPGAAAVGRGSSRS